MTHLTDWFTCTGTDQTDRIFTCIRVPFCEFAPLPPWSVFYMFIDTFMNVFFKTLVFLGFDVFFYSFQCMNTFYCLISYLLFDRVHSLPFHAEISISKCLFFVSVFYLFLLCFEYICRYSSNRPNKWFICTLLARCVVCMCVFLITVCWNNSVY